MRDRPTDEVAWRLAALTDAVDDAVVETSIEGFITSWNANAEKLYGFRRADVLGRSISLILPPDAAHDERVLAQRVLDGERIQHVDVVHRGQDGALLVVSQTIAPVRAPTGDLIGIIRVVQPRPSHLHPQHVSRHLAAIVSSSDDAIVSKDLQGIVTSWNRAAERMFGYSAAEIIGRSIRVIIPDDRQAEEDDVLAHISRGEKVDHFETVRRRKDGAMLSISLTVSPIVDENGAVIGASKVARDITDRKEAEIERARLLDRMHEHARITDALNNVGVTVAAALDRDEIAQAVTDAATQGTGAEFGAFFYNITDERSGGTYQLYKLSGAPKEAFAHFPNPRATAIFAPMFHGKGSVRLDDVTKDPRFGLSPPYHGMPPGHLPVCSYLAVPVKGRSGEVLGGLFFGHSAPGRFTQEHERLAVGIATWASVALENSRLYEGVQVANRLKDEFLATLSHELRTPLNAILGYARMVRTGVIPADQHGRAIETIERNSVSLTQMVEDILDVSRIITGKIRLNVQPVDLPGVVRRAIDVVAPAAIAKQIRIDTILDPNAVPVSGDPERLQQVSWNIISNAVKFTPPGGRVQVRLERVNSHVELVVSDTGIGISPDFLPHMFERFRQADGSTNRERGGLGLGLGIARELIELHGGTIEVSSAGVGEGSTFLIKLPLTIVHPALHSPDRTHPITPALAASRTMPDLRGVRVLAVDDDRDALGMVREILEAAGAYVAVADTALAALETIEIVRPDVLVLDLGLPRMDGFALIARVRQSPDAIVRGIPAAALTAYARSEDRTKSLSSGFQLHLSKPIDPSELLAATAVLAKRIQTDASK